MLTTLEVLFAPAEFAALPQRSLSNTVCVVFDVLRATSTIVTALGNGAKAIIPVAEISEALEIRHRDSGVLLAGERDGVRIESRLTGGVTFDLGNSPREFTRERSSGRIIVTTTTNGTRALRACFSAQTILLGSFLNLDATVKFLLDSSPSNLLLVCGGTHEQMAYEDVLGAGALCELLWPKYGPGSVADSALIARQLFQLEEKNLVAAFSRSRNGSRLLNQPALRDDVVFCAQRDVFDLVAKLEKDGRIQAEMRL